MAIYRGMAIRCSKRPNLDRLAEESIRLTDFHVAPMCTPTRGQLLTGLDACRNGATSVCAGRSFMRPDLPTMAGIFSDNGYETGLFGKWHLGDSHQNLPRWKGFHESVHHLGWGITSMADVWENDCFDGRFLHNGVLEQFPGYCTDVWFNLSIDWMKKCQAANKPFFLYLTTNAPHGPHWVPDKYKEPYVDQRGGLPGFFGMIANVDENVGRLEAFLTESGLKENTIVIFFHDNGGTAGVNLFNAGMRGRKTTYYEGGHRAACFVRWPAHLKPRDVDELTQVQDLLPTLIDLCGLERPQVAQFDGTSLAPLLRGEVAKLPERMLVVQYGQKPEKFDGAVLWQKWRLVKGTELYDLRTDPGQEKDVAASQPQVLHKMRNHYEAWWREVGPLVRTPVPIVLGADDQAEVVLSAADWWNVYCDNMKDLREGKPANGPWHVKAEREGKYRVALRRWPREADAAIAAGVPEFQGVDGGLPAGKALQITHIRLRVGTVFDQTLRLTADAKEVVFTIPLEGGKPTELQSYCYDASGKELCGAYFAYVSRQ